MSEKINDGWDMVKIVLLLKKGSISEGFVGYFSGLFV